MDENNNKPNQYYSQAIGSIQKPVMCSHSYTVKETKTMRFPNKEILKKRIRGEALNIKNDDETRYFIVENGTVFKHNTETSLFY